MSAGARNLLHKASIVADIAASSAVREYRTRGFAELAVRREHAATVERVYFFHIRKTGGTSVARSFLALGGEEPDQVHWRMKRRPHATTSGPYVFVGADRPLIERGEYFFAWSHAPAGWLHLPAGTFRVTVLRDPVDRVLSLYRYLADPTADEGQPFPAREDERRWAVDGLSTFLDRVPRRHLMAQLHMFSQAFEPSEAASVAASCDEVILTSELAAGTARLSDRLGVPLEPRRERSSRSTAEPRPDEIDRLKKMLDPEYEMMERLAQLRAGAASPPAESSQPR